MRFNPLQRRIVRGKLEPDMIVEELKKLVLSAVQSLQAEGILNETKNLLVSFEHPENTEHGDYSTNIALILGQKLKQNPKEIAEDIATKLQSKKPKFLDLVKVEGSGFINFFLSQEYLLKELLEIVSKKEKYEENFQLAGE